MMKMKTLSAHLKNKQKQSETTFKKCLHQMRRTVRKKYTLLAL